VSGGAIARFCAGDGGDIKARLRAIYLPMADAIVREVIRCEFASSLSRTGGSFARAIWTLVLDTRGAPRRYAGLHARVLFLAHGDCVRLQWRAHTRVFGLGECRLLSVGATRPHGPRAAAKYYCFCSLDAAAGSIGAAVHSRACRRASVA